MEKLGMMGFYVPFLFLIGLVSGIEDYCSKNTFNKSGKYMDFTKEPTYEEFSLDGKFKGLHCCAKGYRSIEWYKDDKLYPWALDVSNFIIFPESANQTIYTQNVREVDAGNYTCVLKNDTVIHSHTIHLKVFEKVPDEAKITYISGDTEVRNGESLRLFCEAFAGQIDLPDAYSEANWKKVAENGTIFNVPLHVKQIKTTREDSQTFGTYLMIPKVQKEDFGQYQCIISKPGNTISKLVTVSEKVDKTDHHNLNPIPLAKLLMIMSMILFAICFIVIFYIKFGLKLQVRLKEAFERPSEDDGKNNDVLILYSPQDSEIALGVLSHTLKEHYGYRVVAKELCSNISTWYSNLKPDADESRRIAFVLSPSVLNSSWDSPSILNAINQLQSLGPELIVIALKELPRLDVEVKNSQGETLKSVTRKVGIIPWRQRNDLKFWYMLRLKMPARNRRIAVGEEQVCRSGSSTEDSRLKMNDEEKKEEREVLDDLV